MIRRERTLWAIKMVTENRLDGRREMLGGAGSSRVAATFRTRKEAQAFIDREFGYLRKRPDLRAEPHGWRMPKPIKVLVTLEEIIR